MTTKAAIDQEKWLLDRFHEAETCVVAVRRRAKRYPRLAEAAERLVSVILESLAENKKRGKAKT